MSETRLTQWGIRCLDCGDGIRDFRDETAARAQLAEDRDAERDVPAPHHRMELVRRTWEVSQ